MKNKKLNLKALKVKSFVTNIKDDNVYTIKGGSGINTCTPECAPPELTKRGCSFLYCE